MLRIIGFICLVAPFFACSAEISNQVHYVTIKQLNVRAAPSDKAPIVGKRIYRQNIYIEELKGEWARIERYDDKLLSDGSKSSSWVLLKYLSTDEPEAPKTKYEKNAISEQIVRSTSDMGRYFLVYLEKSASNFIVITSRIGVESSGYTKMEINCSQLNYRELAYTEGHIEQFELKEDKPTNWIDIVPGSSKSDTVHYVCGTRSH